MRHVRVFEGLVTSDEKELSQINHEGKQGGVLREAVEGSNFMLRADSFKPLGIGAIYSELRDLCAINWFSLIFGSSKKVRAGTHDSVLS